MTEKCLACDDNQARKQNWRNTSCDGDQNFDFNLFKLTIWIIYFVMVNVFIFVTQYNFITKCFCFFYFNLKYYSLFVFVRKMVYTKL